MNSNVKCYKPIVRAEDHWNWTKAKDGHLYHPAKVFSTDRLEEYQNKAEFGRYTYDLVPCGQCIGCRLENSRMWANRGYLESLSSQHNYFVTLTYDDEWLTIPEEFTTDEGLTFTEIDELGWKGTLVPNEFKQFMNTLRKIFERDYNFTGIRFMGCGEYGEQGRRPHYHFILFNCPFPAETFYNPRVNWEKNVYWQNTILERAWTKGISNITDANWNNIAYVARYVTKKMKGQGSEEFYACQGEIKEFFRTSRDPGIGRDYYEAHKNEIYKNDKILIRNNKGNHWVTPPKYFDNLYEKECPELFEKVKKKRKKATIAALKVKAETTSLTQWEQLQIELATKEQQTLTLRRNRIEEVDK